MPDAPKSKAFYLDDKSILNLEGLYKEIKNMPVEKYRHYASETHNYFSDWIRDILKHRKLAKELRKTKTKFEAEEVLEKHLYRKETKEEQTKELKQFVISEEPVKEEEKEEAGEEEEKEEVKEEKIVVGTEPKSTEDLLKNIAKDEREIKNFLWKHFAWDMAKEFMYGMAIGILIGFVLSKLFFAG